jgi:hypothetical protein
MDLRYLLIFCVIACWKAYGQKPANSDKFAHTFSIIAQDPVTGDKAVGVQSHWFSEGTAVPWGKSGVEVVAMKNKDAEAALKAYNSAEKLLSNTEDIKFWKAVALVNSNQVKMSIPIFEPLFMNDKRGQRLLKRLPESDLISIEKSALDYLLNL